MDDHPVMSGNVLPTGSAADVSTRSEKMTIYHHEISGRMLNWTWSVDYIFSRTVAVLDLHVT